MKGDEHMDSGSSNGTKPRVSYYALIVGSSVCFANNA